MRKVDSAFLLAGAISLSILLAVSSCEENIKSEPPAPKRQLIEQTLQASQWNAYFNQAGQQDLSSSLIGFTFIFQGDGSLQVIRNNESIIGNWSIYPSTRQKLKLNIELAAKTSDLKFLQQDWSVVDYNEGIVKLRVAGANESHQELILEKV